MSASFALQQAVFARLTGYAPLAAVIYGRVYDDPPKDAAYPFVSFGPMDAVVADADCVDGATETLQIDVWSNAQDGQRECKAILAHVRAALHRFEATLSSGRLVGGVRVVLAQTIPDPVQHITHGVLQVEADLED
jgi:hypothetical protein